MRSTIGCSIPVPISVPISGSTGPYWMVATIIISASIISVIVVSITAVAGSSVSTPVVSASSIGVIIASVGTIETSIIGTTTIKTVSISAPSSGCRSIWIFAWRSCNEKIVDFLTPSNLEASRIFVDKAEKVIVTSIFTGWVLALAISFSFVKNVKFIRETIAGSVITCFSLYILCSI